MNRKPLFLGGAILTLVIILGACGLSPAQVEQAAQTVESMPPSQLAALSTTVEALPQEQLDALATSAVAAGYPTLSAEQQSAVVTTVQAARATATAINAGAAAPMAASSGERVNATQAPEIAPVIVYFFASAPSESAIKSGMKYYLNYTTQNANRVEIYGNVMPDPVQGSFPVYQNQTSDDWVLWAANDQVWVEQPLQVRPDSDTGATLQNVTVAGTSITLTFRDPQFVDGDVIDLDVNGIRILDKYVTQGRHVSFPVQLNSGVNNITIHSRNVGITAPNVTEVSVSNVLAGPVTQVTRGLNKGETQTFTISAP